VIASIAADHAAEQDGEADHHRDQHREPGVAGDGRAEADQRHPGHREPHVRAQPLHHRPGELDEQQHGEGAERGEARHRRVVQHLRAQREQRGHHQSGAPGAAGGRQAGIMPAQPAEAGAERGAHRSMHSVHTFRSRGVSTPPSAPVFGMRGPHR
jgi:hypothetical protein